MVDTTNIEELRRRVVEAEEEVSALEKSLDMVADQTVRTKRADLLRLCKENAAQLKAQLSKCEKFPS